MKRRSFLKVVGGAAGGYALSGASLFGQVAVNKVPQFSDPSGLPRRLLGRTGQKLSVVGFPGLALSHHDQEASTAGIRKAFDAGVNYFDVAPAYGKDGECEIKMGVGLQQLDREKIFLSCKTKMRDAAGARQELERSLKRLKTDYFDLYQLHHLWDPKDVVKALDTGGALETVLKAKEEGKVRAIGFSAHTNKAALDAMKGFRFDTVMFPINFVEYYTIGFGKEVIELANQQGAALISIKPISRGAWPQGMARTRQWWYRAMETQGEVDLAMRWTLSQPGLVTGIPPSFLDLLDKCVVAGKTYQPITADENSEVKLIAASSLSLFQREEDRIAGLLDLKKPLYPDSPYEDIAPSMHA